MGKTTTAQGKGVLIIGDVKELHALIKRGILTEILYSGGRDFYPALAEVGKEGIERKEAAPMPAQ